MGASGDGGSRDFAVMLRDQLGFLKASCARFDEGELSEAMRIALAIRVLLHDTRRGSVSLLTRLGAREAIRLLSTMPQVEAHLPPEFQDLQLSPPVMFTGGLVRTTISSASGASLSAPLGDVESSRLLPVESWWRERVWVSGGQGITRAEVVLGAADKDGGAHVDLDLKAAPEYEMLSRSGASGFVTRTEDGRTTLQLSPDPDRRLPGEALPDAHRHMLRQMGYEILHSPEVVSLAA